MQIRGSQGWFLSLNRWAQDWHFNSVSLVFEIDSLKPPSLTPCVRFKDISVPYDCIAGNGI